MTPTQSSLPRWFKLIKLAPMIVDIIDEIVKEIRSSSKEDDKSTSIPPPISSDEKE